MDHELLNIFDDHRNLIGVATRAEVHTIGYWHETFHCWFITKHAREIYIYLQLRSKDKKDHPSLFDITAAGHLLSHETVKDGVREVKEELGIELSFEDLTLLDTLNYCFINEEDNFIDKELATIFLYNKDLKFTDFILQKEEVSGIVRTEFAAFADLWLGKRERVLVEGITLDSDGMMNTLNDYVGKERFVPHGLSYYQSIIKLISNHS